MTFYGTVAPSLCHSREHSRFVPANAFGKSSYFRTGRRFSFTSQSPSVPPSVCEAAPRTHPLSRTRPPIRRYWLESRQFAFARWACDPQADVPTRMTTALVMEEVGQMASPR